MMGIGYAIAQCTYLLGLRVRISHQDPAGRNGGPGPGGGRV